MKNAVVIGGLSGIGKGIVDALKKRGYHVLIGDISADPSRSSDDLYFVDACSSESVHLLASKIEIKIQHLDVLICTVGGIDEGSVLHIPLKKWKWIFDMNVFSYINTVDAFLPLLEKSAQPRIMVTGSVSGFGDIDTGLGLYAISKHALLGYFKVLRNELAEKGIQVSLLIPSAIKGRLAENSAKMREHSFQEDPSIMKGSQPKGRTLEDPAVVGIQFVADFIDGKTIITNNPLPLKKKCQSKFDDLTDAL